MAAVGDSRVLRARECTPTLSSWLFYNSPFSYFLRDGWPHSPQTPPIFWFCIWSQSWRCTSLCVSPPSSQSQSAFSISDWSNNRCVDTCSGRARCQKYGWGEVERECEEEECGSGGIRGKQEEAPWVSAVRRTASPTRTNSLTMWQLQHDRGALWVHCWPTSTAE